MIIKKINRHLLRDENGERMINVKQFTAEVDKRKTSISVVGLGHIGLPLALVFADAGFKTYGYDSDETKVSKLLSRSNYLPEEAWLDDLVEKLVGKSFFPLTKNHSSDVAVITVPASYNKKTGSVHYDHIVSAAQTVGKNMQPGTLVILESTVGPGTTTGLVKKVLEESSGLIAGEDFGVAFAPERINPGDKDHRVYNTPRVIGGSDALSTASAAYLYRQIVPHVHVVSSPTVAEIVKLVENTFRDIDVAKSNLLSQISHELGVDVHEVLDAAKTKWNFSALDPRVGVGGNCLPHDPYFLLSSIDPSFHTLIAEARRINESMPRYTVNKLMNVLTNKNKSVRGLKVAIIGLTYKGNTSDIRNTPAQSVTAYLNDAGVRVVAYDPYINGNIEWVSTTNLESAIKDADGIILCADHDEFKAKNLPALVGVFAPQSIFVDGMNMFNKADFASSTVTYVTL